MIYLIGGPPKCGKTTLAKEFSKKSGIPFVNMDNNFEEKIEESINILLCKK